MHVPCTYAHTGARRKRITGDRSASPLEAVQQMVVLIWLVCNQALGLVVPASTHQGGFGDRMIFSKMLKDVVLRNGNRHFCSVRFTAVGKSRETSDGCVHFCAWPGSFRALLRKRADAACTFALPACTLVGKSARTVHFYANAWNLTI